MATQTRADGAAERAVERRFKPTSTPGPFELLESRLSPPQLREGSIPRPELIERLNSARDRKVVMVSAPPGYGKTTLLAQWMSRSRRPFGWITLDDRDNDPVVMLSYIAAALDRIEDLPAGVFEALSPPAASIDGRILPRLGSALAGIGRSFALVLDDVHAIRSPQCLDAIEMLVDHLPAGSQFVLSGQLRPSPRVGALRAHGQLLELGPGELRMNDAEAGELLAAAEVELGADQVRELVERTEGWPGGLYLAALSIRTTGGSIASFRGNDRLVTDYLRDVLLTELPEERLRFLTRTAVLDQMSGALCDAVLETDGSARALESLEGSNLFVVPLDSNREWYRYHSLFRDLLRAELERSEPDAIARLLGRAADWCDEHGEANDAVGYAQAAGDVTRVARLISLHGQGEYQLGHAATVDAWLGWLEEQGALGRVPALAAQAAWYQAIRGHAGKAELWADAAEHAQQQNGSRSGSAAARPWLAVLHAAQCRRGVEAMRADAERALRDSPRESPWWLTATFLLATSSMLAGDLDAADDQFADLAEAALELGGSNGASIAVAERGLLAADRGDWHAAEQFSEQASLIVRRYGIEDYPLNALVYALGARVGAHRGETSKASEHLARVQRLRPKLTHAILAFSIQTRLELARAYVAIADTAGARTLLREANGLIRRGMGFGILEETAEEIKASLESARAEAPGASTLTTAELRLLPYLPTHLSFREIGERLYLSRHTVKSQAMSIYRKLDVTSRNESVERARALGLLED